MSSSFLISFWSEIIEKSKDKIKILQSKNSKILKNLKNLQIQKFKNLKNLKKTKKKTTLNRLRGGQVRNLS